jgi:DNA polymerase elongation subunit (family B)
MLKRSGDSSRRLEIKILLLDIETSPNIAHVWGLWKQNVGINQLMQSSQVICWAAKWYGENDVIYDSIYKSDRSHMINQIYGLVNEADVIITYNGVKFDMPTLNREFVTEGLTPPAPYKNIDLYQTVKKNFNFPSFKLEYVAKAFKVGQKVKHAGHELWVGCMANNAESWEKMEEYNIQDTVLLEDLYSKLQPWVRPHPNAGLFNEGATSVQCTHCGSTNLHKRGYAYTTVSKFQRYQCQDCGSWCRSRLADNSRENLLTPVN